jgi:hypothetical protein
MIYSFVYIYQGMVFYGGEAKKSFDEHTTGKDETTSASQACQAMT